MTQTVSRENTASQSVVADTSANCSPLGRPLNVCMMVDNLGRAGVETQMLQLIGRMDRSIVHPRLCLLNGTGRQSRKMEPTDCHVERLGVASLRHPSTLAKAVRFAKYLRRHKIDVVHPHFPDSLYFAAPVAKLAGVPCVVRFRVNTGYWMRPIDRRLARFYNRFIDATLVNCQACREAVIAQEHAPPDSITIIPNGVDLARFERLSAEEVESAPRSGRRIGAVANLRPVKGLDVFLRAAARLASHHGDLEFLIAGEGKLRSSLESLADELGIRDRLRLLGKVADVPGFLRNLDVAVLSSRCEGAPNVIMEYMAAGKPIVATDVGGVGEMIAHEETGLLVPPEDPERLADAVDRLLSDRALASRLAAAARRQAFAEYGLDLQARRYEEFYCRCFAKAAGLSKGQNRGACVTNSAAKG
jgi:glycosyltransferase involved in cell wall biosynthesis